LRGGGGGGGGAGRGVGSSTSGGDEEDMASEDAVDRALSLDPFESKSMHSSPFDDPLSLVMGHDPGSRLPSASELREIDPVLAREVGLLKKRAGLEEEEEEEERAEQGEGLSQSTKSSLRGRRAHVGAGAGTAEEEENDKGDGSEWGAPAFDRGDAAADWESISATLPHVDDPIPDLN